MQTLRKPSGETDHTIPNILLLQHGHKPAWLLCQYEDNRWTVSDGPNRPAVTINFDVIIPGGRTLSDYPNFYHTIKRIAYGVRNGPLAIVDSGMTQVTIVNNLTLLARWMIAQDIEKFKSLEPSDISEYAKNAMYGAAAILNAEAVLQEYLEKQMEQANFQDNDTVEVRRSKAYLVFPYRKEQGNSRKLAREEILRRSGLGGSGTLGGAISAMLDETERTCGYNQDGIAKNRVRSSRDDDDQPVTEEHLRRFLMSFEYLWQHRRYLDDAIMTPPFGNSHARTEAKKYGRAVGRTATIPFTQATHFIERSVRWVLDYAPVLLELKDFVEKTDYLEPDIEDVAFPVKLASIISWPEGPANPFPILVFRKSDVESWDTISYNESLRDGMALSQALVFLMVACAVVIAAFTARRVSEIIGLKVGCIQRDDALQPWMSCFILKTVQGESKIPVPELVVKAVEILERLSEKARIATSAPYIFQYTLLRSEITYGLSSDGFPRFPLSVHLSRFGYFVDVPAMPDGNRWHFKTHQFRRFFAILYIWVYEKGDWGALQWHLRHFESEMTRRYVTENEIGQIISLVNKERAAEILTNCVINASPIGGLEGGRLRLDAQKIHDKLSQRIEVVSESKFKKSISRYIERTGLEIRGFPWGFCATRSRDDSATCQCSGTSDPMYSQATNVTCIGCEFGMVTAAAAPFLQTSNEFHRLISESPDMPPMLRRASIAIVKKQSLALAELET